MFDSLSDFSKPFLSVQDSFMGISVRQEKTTTFLPQRVYFQMCIIILSKKFFMTNVTFYIFYPLRKSAL